MMLGSPLPVLLAAACCAAAGAINTDGPAGPPYALADDIQVPVGNARRHGDALGGTGFTGKNRLWPQGQVRYAIAISYTNAQNPAAYYLQDDDDRIAWAVAHWEEETCIRFTKCSSPFTCEEPFMVFVSDASRCDAPVGTFGGVSEVNIGTVCNRGWVAHEIGHVLGLTHEHTRNDRDEYVTLNESNIWSMSAGDFEKVGTTGRDLGPYDYGSLMHHGRYRGAIDSLYPTIDAPTAIGQRAGLSQGDVDTIHFLYNTCSVGFDAPRCLASKSDSIVHTAYPGMPFTVEFNAEWVAGGEMTVSYAWEPVGEPEVSLAAEVSDFVFFTATVPEGGVVSDSAKALVVIKPDPEAVGGTFSFSTSFAATISDVPVATCSVVVRVAAGPTDVPTTDAPPTAVPQTAAPAPCTSGAIQEFGNCHYTPACCAAGLHCREQNPWYSQCLMDAGSTPPPPPPCSSTLIRPFGNCHIRPACCAAGTLCVNRNPWYSQCLPNTMVTAAPPTEPSCNTIIANFGNCHAAPTCCAEGTYCLQHNIWYSQCLMVAGSTSAPPSPPACGPLIQLYGPCLAAPTCCAEGLTCFEHNRWYSQCLPEATAMPSGDTPVPATRAPVTNPPATRAPATSAPMTAAPETDAPLTTAPRTTVPLTTAPATTAPSGAPATAAPVVRDNLSLLADAVASGTTVASGTSFANLIDDDLATYWSPNGVPTEISIEWATPKVLSGFNIIEAPGFTDIVQSWILLEAETERVMASGTGVDGPVVVEYAKGVKKVTFKVFNTAIDTPRPRVVEFQTFGWEVTGAPQTPAPETAAPPTTAAPPIKTPPTNAPATTAPPTNAPSTLSPAPPGDNLSLLGDASASGSSAAPGTSFADMIDDDVNTFWSPTSLPATIVIRWAAPKSVSSINIVEYLPMVSDSAGGRASDFPGSINGWSLIDEEGDRVLASGNGFSGPITFDAVVLSDIRLSIFDASGGMPRVAEFQTFGVDPALPDNLSLRDDAVADGSSELPGNSFAAAIDGRFETFWAPASLPANISVEWPSARAVGSVEIYEYFSTVSVTDSGLASDLLPGRIGSWTLVGEFGAVLASGSGIRGPISLDGSSLRKVTLVIFDSTGGMPSVAEFETYAEGTITSPVPDNLSLLRDASASGSTAAPGASFANAIDDDGSTYWSPTSLPAQISVEWATAKLVSSVYIVEQRQIFPTRTGATQAVGFPGSIGAWSLVDESGSVLASGTGITDEVYFAAVSTRKVTLNIFDSGDVMPRVSEFETYNDGTPTSPVLDNLSLLPSASADGSTAAPGTSFANAIDGSLDTIWSPITLPAYISVEWPTERLVSSVVIVEQPFIASGRGAAAQAISFAGSIGAWNLETEFGDVLASGTGIHAEIFFDGVYLRKVTLNIIDAGDMLPRVSEFETYADGAPPVREPENLSLLRDAVADGSTAAPGTSFANAIDGDLDTIWRPSDLPASISVEWSTERLISSVVIVEQQVIPSGRSMATQAVEGVIEAWSLTDEGGDRILASGTGIVGPITFPPTILQKVVFRIFTADGLPRISEFETFVRTPEVPVIDNLSLLKDAVAGGSSAASGTSFANAIDGDLSTVWSPTVVPAEISVEWSTERLISSVVILEQPPIISGRNMATQAANFPSNIGSWELMDEEGDRIIASGTGIDGPISFSPTFVRKVVLLIFTADGNPRVAEFETFGESPVSPVHDNLSLLRGAVASGTSEASGSTFAGVIDGRLTTYWSPASLPAQISVEWPIPQTVGSVVIVEQSAVPSSRHGAAQAVGFPGDIGAWTLRDFDGDRVLASGTGIRGPITFAAVSLRKLTLDIAEAGDGVPRIFEFETYSGAAGSDNLALALDTIAVGSTSESGTSSSNVIDDDASTYWSPTSLSASISVEWATERLVGSVNIVESLGFTGNIRTWTLLDWEGDAVLASGEGGLGGEISFAAVSLRKIVLDIEANAGGMPRVAEFQVYAPKVLPLPAPGNLFRRDGATASGSTAASGSSFAAAIDGSAATYWSPLVVPGRISVEWPSVQLVASVVVVEAVGFAGGVRSWMLVDDDADSVLASGTGVAGPINFSPASLRRISLQILTADGIVRIAELEAYSLPVPVVAV